MGPAVQVVISFPGSPDALSSLEPPLERWVFIAALGLSVAMPSLTAGPRFLACGLQELQLMGCFSVALGIFLEQGLNLFWQVDS